MGILKEIQLLFTVFQDYTFSFRLLILNKVILLVGLVLFIPYYLIKTEKRNNSAVVNYVGKLMNC